MYARIVPIRAVPERREAVVAFFREVVAPAIRAQPGFVRLLLLDDEQGACLSISFWESDTALLSSQRGPYLATLYARLAEIARPLPVMDIYRVAAEVTPDDASFSSP